jgi:putative flippase GtrA
MVRELLRAMTNGEGAVRLRRFFLVGLFASAVQTALLWMLVEWGSIYYLLAAAVSIEITILMQFFLNNAWTFHDSKRTGIREKTAGLLKTNLVRGTAIPIQLGALYGLVTFVGWPYIIANGGAIALSGVYRYVLDARWTWQ